MKKINIAELLKDCPKGMELDCTLFENVTFEEVRTCCSYPIKIASNGWVEFLTEYGGVSYKDNAKCVIFPKGKTTWVGFQRPFKDGDIIFEDGFHSICIFKKEGNIKGTVDYYCGISLKDFFVKDEKDIYGHFGYISEYRLATEKEKQKLFDAIKANGYKWNADTKTLEDLIVPKFKVGDRIKEKRSGVCGEIIDVQNNRYDVKIDDKGLYVYFREQNDWELLPHKFDITTLKPFDKVLVRDRNQEDWAITFFSHCSNLKIYKYSCISYTGYAQCIPFEGNEHLLGTTNDCDEYYKNWE